MCFRSVSLFTILLLILTPLVLHAQTKKDTVEKKSFTRKTFREGMKLISTNPKDTIVNEKSVDPYLAYAGKIIRHINFERFGFEKSIYDTAKKVDRTVAKVANSLHAETREKIIRKHLFINKDQPLNPHKLADNERYIRGTDFILDCRIFVTPIEGTDSVDLTVLTRDVFSLGATAGGSANAPKIGIYDVNVDGRGQRIQLTTLIDPSRSPAVGLSVLYRKSSIFGSLTNLELGYTQINSGISIGDEPEFATLMRLTRPLVSPYSRWAGGGEISRNWSQNVYKDPDSIFLKYKYTIYNGWLGYNIGIRKGISNRNRKFLATRYFNGYYNEQPDQEDYSEEVKYNNLYGYLTEFTFYRQNYYKTRYVFGFGRTEDIPYGFTLGLSGGYIRELQTERPYGAIKLNYAEVGKKGNFYNFQFQTGGYYRNNEMEDFIVQGGAAYFSKLWQFNRYKVRNYISSTYTQLINQTVINWLNVNSKEIPGLNTDSVYAAKRLALHLESELFTPRSILGFRFAPLVAIDVVAVDCTNCLHRFNEYWGFSTGFRTRNENLIFGTMEVKLTYIPNDEYGNSKFVFGFKQNLQFKNTNTFVNEPALIRYN
ncbi:MAG: hypothetical protein KBF45_13410 [Cyclobacteriaceae bacterium]|nr:hypothetical protein [Cyclobacteriaceae bacterium]